ncbi:MAG: recombinase family protein [Acidobacteriota bacterium]|nr:recombinase family protein [Acidobacteriota bacterium]
MRAAIYSRKSNDQGGIADENKSVTRQVDHARAYARRKGWTVLDHQVYIDDGISGAEFANRPGFLRLMNALTPKPKFDVLIMSEESRLGREAIETAYALKQIVSAGVRVFFYLEDRERILQTPTDKLLMSVTAFADELERERARQRTFDALARKARAGHVTGGRVFGYDNVEVMGPDGTRSHVERRINLAEAAVVRRLFSLADEGMGQRLIARALNDAAAPAPRAQQGRPNAWSPSSVFEALRRDLYRGAVIWNRSQKRDTWGRSNRHDRAEAEWIQRDDATLRIVDEALWLRVQARLTRKRAAYRAGGGASTPMTGRVSKYLLSGYVECGLCGGRLTVRTQPSGRFRIAKLSCWHYVTRGLRGCANNYAAPLDLVDGLVLDVIEKELLSPAVVEPAIREAVAMLKESATDDDTDQRRLITRLAELDGQARRLSDAIAAGITDVPAIHERLRGVQTQRRQVASALTGRRVPVDALSVGASVRAFRARLADWRELLLGDPEEARRVLDQVLTGRVVLTPRLDRPTISPIFDVRMSLTTQGLFEGILAPQAVASPTGFEPVF